MLDFADQPYRFFPPRPNRLIAALLRVYNRRRRLPRTLAIASVQIEGVQSLQHVYRSGDRLLLTPNHPTHSDAAILLEALARARVLPAVMTAYDVFLRSRMDAWVMQKLGCFSVDREGSDPQAMAEAAATIERGRRALVIFPEGNVYLTNDQVTLFHDGAALLATRAARRWAEVKDGSKPAGGRILVVPVAIKATYIDDVRPAVAARLRELTGMLDVAWDASWTPLEALRSVGRAALQRNLKLRGFDVPSGDDLPTMIEHAAGTVLAELERKLAITVSDGAGLFDRVRAARRVIHEVRIDPQRTADHPAAATWADQAMLAFTIASYSGRYVSQSPTLDRIAETTEKLAEDVHRRMMPPLGRRQAHVRFLEPIVVNDLLADCRPREAMTRLTAAMESAIQIALDAMTLNTRGAQRWDESLGRAG